MPPIVMQRSGRGQSTGGYDPKARRFPGECKEKDSRTEHIVRGVVAPWTMSSLASVPACKQARRGKASSGSGAGPGIGT